MQREPWHSSVGAGGSSGSESVCIHTLEQPVSSWAQMLGLLRGCPGVPSCWHLDIRATWFQSHHPWCSHLQRHAGVLKWPLETHYSPLLQPLLLSSLVFVSACMLLKLRQSQNALPFHPIMCPTPQGRNTPQLERCWGVAASCDSSCWVQCL